VRDPNRIPQVTEKLSELWKLMPDMRFGQLFYMLNQIYNDGNDFFSIEDDDWINYIENEIRKQSKK
jgi:hypothetical protein